MVMPPTASRPHSVDLLLCGHHFRVSQASLQAAGADVYDNHRPADHGRDQDGRYTASEGRRAGRDDQ